MNAKLKAITPVTKKSMNPWESLFPTTGNTGRNLWPFDDVFGSLFSDLDTFQKDIPFPKYNTKRNLKTGDTILEIALAGYDKNDIKVELTPENKLRVSNDKNPLVEDETDPDDLDWTYTNRGIAERHFDISWSLGPYQEVSDIQFKNGILSIMIKNTEPPKPESRLLKIK
jgi:HSP20 family molecular chaperone IbpA